MKRFFSSIILCFCLIGFCSAQTFKAEHIRLNPQKIEDFGYTLVSSRHSTSVAESFFDMFVELMAEIWAIQTIYVSYDDYPYASDGKYIHFTNLEKAVAAMIGPQFSVTPDGTNGEYGLIPPKDQFYRFALDTSFFVFPNKTIGNQTRFEGIIWKFFGPMVQFDTSTNFSLFTDSNKPIELNTNLLLGLQFSILQYSPFSLYWTFCWNRTQLGGDETLNGIAFQVIARSYPCRPILLEWRGTVREIFDKHSKEYTILESHLELGVMVAGPLEVFGAWRYEATVSPTTIESNGFEIGARYHL